MDKSKVSRQEMIDLLEEAEELDVMPGKHDEIYKRFLFDIDGEKFSSWVCVSYNNGIGEGPFELKRVRPIVKTITKWVEIE